MNSSDPEVIALLDTKPEPKQDRWKRYLIMPAEGGKAVAHTRVTTIAETLDSRYNLELWKVRMAMLGLVARHDLYALTASTKLDDRDKLNKIGEQAIEAAKGSAGANLGTALHRFTERLDRGEELDVPQPWNKDIAAYNETLTKYGFKVDPQYIEQTVIIAGQQEPIAGTLDRLVDFNGKLCIGDLKTGADLDWSWHSIGVQLALYSRATTCYNLESGEHTPFPAVDQDYAYVFHLPAGQARCTIYRVELNASWQAARIALWVRQWRKQRNFATELSVPF